MATKEVPCETDANLKSLHVNILEIVTRMTNTSVGFKTN